MEIFKLTLFFIDFLLVWFNSKCQLSRIIVQVKRRRGGGEGKMNEQFNITHHSSLNWQLVSLFIKIIQSGVILCSAFHMCKKSLF